MIQSKGYERYGLTGNPFRDLASETLETIDIFHVGQEMDDHLRMIIDEIFEKQSKAVVAILGALGMGKTQRLLLIQSWAREKKAYCVFRSINPQAKLVISDVIKTLIDTVPLTFFERNISAPRFYSDLKKAYRSSRKKFDPELIGRAIAGALNARSPSILILNDLHNVDPTAELPDFLQVLYSIVNNLDEGVMIAIGSNSAYFDGIMKRHQSLEERINYKLEVQPLIDTEAQEMVAKRLTAKRLVEDLNPIYPFNNDSISILNAESHGNPRQVLKLSDRIIDQAATERVIQIDAQYATDILEGSRQKRSLPPAPHEILKKLREEARVKRPATPSRTSPGISTEFEKKITEYEHVLEKMEKALERKEPLPEKAERMPGAALKVDLPVDTPLEVAPSMPDPIGTVPPLKVDLPVDAPLEVAPSMPDPTAIVPKPSLDEELPLIIKKKVTMRKLETVTEDGIPAPPKSIFIIEDRQLPDAPKKEKHSKSEASEDTVLSRYRSVPPTRS